MASANSPESGLASVAVGPGWMTLTVMPRGQSGLGHGINSAASTRHAVSEDAADGDNTAARNQMGNRTLDRHKYSPNIDRQHPIEVLQRKRFGDAGRTYASIVHEDIQAAEGHHRLIDRSLSAEPPDAA
jgi:antirestriction protein ArdC